MTHLKRDIFTKCKLMADEKLNIQDNNLRIPDRIHENLKF